MSQAEIIEDLLRPVQQATLEARNWGMKQFVGRRHLLLVSGLGAALAGTGRLAHALTPPAPVPATLADDVRRTDLILVGTFDRFVFRGHSKKPAPTNEFNMDFEADNGQGNRSLNGFVRIGRVLKNVMPGQIELPGVIRLQGPVPSNDHLSYLHKEMIIFANQGVVIRYGEERRRIFGTTRLPMPLEDEGVILQYIKSAGIDGAR